MKIIIEGISLNDMVQMTLYTSECGCKGRCNANCFAKCQLGLGVIISTEEEEIHI